MALSEQNMNEQDQDNLVRVEIFGHEYMVKAPADAQYIRDIADYVNRKMKEIMDGSDQSQSNIRIAILAAMNISDELFTLRKQLDDSHQQTDNRVGELIDIIDEALDE